MPFNLHRAEALQDTPGASWPVLSKKHIWIVLVTVLRDFRTAGQDLYRHSPTGAGLQASPQGKECTVPERLTGPHKPSSHVLSFWILLVSLSWNKHFCLPHNHPIPKERQNLFCLFLLFPNYSPLPRSSSSHFHLFYHIFIGHWPQNVKSLKSRGGALGKSVAEEKSSTFPTSSSRLFLSVEHHEDIRSPRNTHCTARPPFHVSSISSHPPTAPPHKGWKETYRVLHTGFILNQISTGCRLFIQ